ncbi:hypothetical protein QJS04_geneDACA013510 [Acorus gramineus]|uniref:Smr domain-containing protein n=1 Tax=Acorus gramineus TaxID=55184 RepID=A0AAV9AIG1_ACOGR|nr:hypothetical protein QJS04_geneDACA013510 [Acorus gramineus]
MSLSSKGLHNNQEVKINNKVTMLNPNAAEFVPSQFRYSSLEHTKNGDVARIDFPGTSAKAILDRSESNASNNSDDEVHQYWRRQLPDDITPDFKFSGEDETARLGLSIAGLSIHDGRVNGDQHLSNGRGYFNGNSISDLPLDPAVLEDIDAKHVEYLTSQFPGFSAESLADVYYANQCNLSSTIEMLTQLELQVDDGFNPNLDTNTSAPSLTALDFPALPVPDAQNGLSMYAEDDLQQVANNRSGPSGMLRNPPDFASAVRKIASQDPHWKYERNGSTDGNIGSSRSQQLLASSYGAQGRSFHGDKSQSYNSTRAAPIWLDTGDSVANLYSESREEARDLARLRNTCFEQATQAFRIGNKALAKELSNKGKFYGMQMEAAHEKAKEAIFRQRFVNSTATDLYGGRQERMIDLHGLHVNEAVHVLKDELNVFRNNARSSGQFFQVSICVGTGHHTKGSRTPARLPVAVEQFLIKEGIQYTEPQPGLFRVVIY